MDDHLTIHEEKNKRRGMIISTIAHIALILLALWPLLTYPDPPPGQEGILVNLGLPDVGQGDENAGPAEPAVDDEVDEPAEETPVEVEEEPKPEPTPKETKPEPVREKEVVTKEDPNEVALRKRQEEEKKRQEELNRQKQAEEAKKKAAEEEARRKQAAEAARKQAEADKLKDQIGGLFGDGSGKGNTGKPGNQGDPEGDPNASKLEGISTGSGTVGGGLGNRGVVRQHKPTDTSQKEGTVVVSVCVDRSGKVTDANVTQAGTTTSDAQLRRMAVESAQQWQFSTGSQDRQCGTITYRFRLQ
jgi:TonB family protein